MTPSDKPKLTASDRDFSAASIVQQLQDTHDKEAFKDDVSILDIRFHLQD